MNMKHVALFAVAGLLVLAGCQSGMHSSISPEERAKYVKEAVARVENAHKALYESAVSNDLAEIRKCYSGGPRGRSRYRNPFLGDEGRKEDGKSDWLARWSAPRLPLTEADAQAGEALLSEFGAKYLPNAYANYEKRREALAELQQVFNEEFPQPWTIEGTNPKWDSFNKVLERFAKARAETFLCHDELCHYWLLWRLGVLSAGDLAAADAKRLSVPLLPENVARTERERAREYRRRKGFGTSGDVVCAKLPMDGKVSEFAAKYAPASSGLYQKMSREFKEIDALLAEIGKQRRQMDDVRHSRALTAAVAKRNDLARELNALLFQLQTWHMDHRTMEKSADDVARCDADMARKLKPFMDSLPGYVKEYVNHVIADAELVAIPGKSYRMQRTEVTQLQWLLVMGYNPSAFRGLDRPVEHVSWIDCQEFIKRASAMDGRPYRLPTEEEWKYACRAGSTGAWGKRANGECGPLDVMGWYGRNSGHGTHPVAQLEPNAWGLYDMHGNVGEWCQDLSLDENFRPRRSYRGGGTHSDSSDCSAWHWDAARPDITYLGLGFRLVAPLD